MTHEERELEFYKSIDALQVKYEDLLRHKTNTRTGKAGDLLINHFHITIEKLSGAILLDIHRGTYLPKSVQDEIITLFGQHFTWRE